MPRLVQAAAAKPLRHCLGACEVLYNMRRLIKIVGSGSLLCKVLPRCRPYRIFVVPSAIVDPGKMRHAWTLPFHFRAK
jgi:hypothetical protein